MDPELKKVESPLAGTGLETPGQQCPPNGGTRKKGRTTADGNSLVAMGSNLGGNIFSPTTENVDTRVVRTTADITFLQQGHKPKDEDKGSKENKLFDPGRRGEKAPLWNAAVTLFFSGESGRLWEGRCLCFVFFVCMCRSALLFKLLFFSGDRFSTSWKA